MGDILACIILSLLIVSFKSFLLVILIIVQILRSFYKILYYLVKYLNQFIFIILISSLSFSGCKEINPNIIEAGVSKELAILLAKELSDLKYNIFFHVPDSLNKLLVGKEVIEFTFNSEFKEPLILDFRNPGSFVKSVKLNNREIQKQEFNFKKKRVKRY